MTAIHCPHVLPVLEQPVARYVMPAEPASEPRRRGATVVTRPPRRPPVPEHGKFGTDQGRYATCPACAAALVELEAKVTTIAGTFGVDWAGRFTIRKADYDAYRDAVYAAVQLRNLIYADACRMREERARTLPDPTRDRTGAAADSLDDLLALANRKEPTL